MATSLEHQRSKQPATPVAGPYGHPFHPVLVTLPIGAWVASLLFDLISKSVRNGAAYTRGASALLVIGIVGALLAAIFGFMDYGRLASGTRAARTATLHMALNMLAIVGMFANVLLRGGDLDAPSGTPVGPIVLSAVVLGVLGVSGWLGGKLSYHYGVRVADERTQAEGFEFVGKRNRVESGDGMNAPRIP